MFGKVAFILGMILLVELAYFVAVALCLAFKLKDRTHKRYDRGHVYVDYNGAEYHVPREILELYMHIKDSRIHEVQGNPQNPKVFFSWSLALLLPRLAARVFRPFDEAA